MDDREFFLVRRKAEYPAFLRVLRAVPADKLDYAPHEKSPSARQLVWTISAELFACCEMVDTGGINWSNREPPPLEEMVALFERSHRDLDEKVRTMGAAEWTASGELRFDGKTMLKQPIGEFLWFLLFDAIHHRGQLSAYLRPMGAKVPSIYGPSADDPGR